jgi:hypothetical protein
MYGCQASRTGVRHAEVVRKTLVPCGLIRQGFRATQAAILAAGALRIIASGCNVTRRFGTPPLPSAFADAISASDRPAWPHSVAR